MITPTTLDQWIDFNDYYCIQSGLNHDEPKNHVPNTGAWINFLAHFGNDGYNSWDINKDGVVNTTDLTAALSGFYTSPDVDPKALPLDLLELESTFGEGNSFFYPLNEEDPECVFNDVPIASVIFKSTPADEQNVEVTADPESFKLEIICGTTVYKYTFIKKTYLL